MKKNSLFTRYLVLVFCLGLVMACGNKPKKSTSKPKVAIEINSDDFMSYDKEELRVAADSEVTLTLNHTGKMDKKSMGHNVVILKPGTNVTDFAMAAMGAANKDYIPNPGQVIAHTEVIGGGESSTVTFDAPAKGTYDFICSFPGHFGVMKGKFIVE